MSVIRPLYDVFVSHSTRRQTRWSALVENLTAGLNRRGLRVFWDGTNLQTGDYLLPTLVDAIEHSGAGLVVHTPGALKSGWVEIEISTMLRCQWRSQMRLIALKLDTDCPLIPGVAWDETIDAGPPPFDLARLADAVTVALRR